MRALPTLNAEKLEGPSILFWNDSRNDGGLDEWITSFTNLGLQPGRDFDLYNPRAASTGMGEGLGAVLTPELLDVYDVICYSSGDLGMYTLGNGDFDWDPSGDLDMLTRWLEGGGKKLLMTGNLLAADLNRLGPAGTGFLQDVMGLTVDTTGELRRRSGARSIRRSRRWPASPCSPPTRKSGGSFRQWSSLLPWPPVYNAGTAVSLAEFLDPWGSSGAYPFSAATLNHPVNFPDCTVISLPYDLMFVCEGDPSDANPLISVRTRIMRDVLAYFGIEGNPGDATEVPEALKFAVGSHPNPFNPDTKIEYTMPAAGRLTLKVFNLRGELVRVLLDSEVPQGAGHVMWDGCADGGAPVSSGVYFCEAKSATEKLVHKMTMVK